MKKLLVLFLAVILLCTITCTSLSEEISQYIHIAYSDYDGLALRGSVEIPDDVFFVRASFFLPDGAFFVVIIPISREGLFELDIAVNCVSIVVGIVDSPMALIPGQGTIYKTATVTFI